MSLRRNGTFACLVLLTATIAWAHSPSTAPTTAASLHVERLTLEAGAANGHPVRLIGHDAHQQLLATAHTPGGDVRDVTRSVHYAAEPAGVVQVSATGDVTPLHDGSAVVTATADGNVTATLNLTVERSGESLPINFANQIVPVFTKTGCNTGGCHGKSSGQNGFRLSLLGFEPGEDYEHLVAESRGRRLSPAAPEHSLLLLKATAMVPHGGGKRMEVGGEDYQLLARWIRQGMPRGEATDPAVAAIDVYPASRTLPLSGVQQLLVVARYTDGSTQDVTRGAVYQSSDPEMGSVDAAGHVAAARQPGSFSVMVRYQGKVATFQATLPLGAPVDHLPPARNFVDELVFNQLKAMGMPPSDVCDDGTFLRRVTLDVAGRLPTVEEVRGFLADPSPDKRDRCIDRLLDSPDYADFFANKWSALLRNRRAQPNHQRGNYLFHDWIRDSFYANKPYDQFVRAILTASGDVAHDPPTEWYRQVTTPTAELEDAAQLFLGTRIQCAQCHHHPYEKWSQQDYYGLAAFFSQVTHKPAEGGEETVYARRAAPVATNIKTGQPVKATGLGAGGPADAAADDDARQALVDWMVRPDNRFFAPALVNRYWKHFLGRGIVEPEDDLRDTNPPTNPQLLRALATHFVQSRYDLKDLIRTICRSSTYQRSAEPNAYNHADKQCFSRYYPKRLNAEVLLDAVDAVAQSHTSFAGLPAGTRAVQLPDNSFNAGSYFLTVFGRPESSSACECERSQDASLAQSLHLLNSKEILTKVASDAGRAAAAAAVGGTGDDEARIRELYLLAYARQPVAEELALARQYVTRQVRDKDGKLQPVNRRAAYEDVVWALINTKEFLFNH